MNRYGVIDLGTNTFHLFIAEPLPDGGFRELYRDKTFVKLAEAGIERIGEAPYQRALDTLARFAHQLQIHAVTTVRAIGTAALRTALNGPDLLRDAAQLHGLHIELIDGREEARLIHRGVTLVVPATHHRQLVMDIGGGSVEFILADHQRIYWAESFPVGVAVLYRRFHTTDPISPLHQQQLRAFLQSQLAPLALALAQYPTTHLVGSAGTFDVIAAQLAAQYPNPHCAEVDLSTLSPFLHEVVAATRAQRLAHPVIPPDRADMIVVALLLVSYVLELAPFSRLSVSGYSLKEGVMAELMPNRM